MPNKPSGKNQPHDAVFKAFFSDSKIAKNYLLHYTPVSFYEQLDFSVFRKIDAAFVNSRFGVSFTDVLYECKMITGQNARLLFIFEHKSYLPNHPVYLQLLDYLLQVWEDDLKNKRQLSTVIPIVVYHGTKPWDIKPFHDYFKGLPENWTGFIPNFGYLLTDLSRVPPQVIQDKEESEYLRNLFLALKFAWDQSAAIENWKKIFTFGVVEEEDDRERILFQTLTLYFFNLFEMSQAKIKELSEDLSTAENSWVNAIPEILGERWKKEGLQAGRKEGFILGREEGRQEGRQEGREEGREEGYTEATRQFILKTIQHFPEWTDMQVAEFVSVPETVVVEVRTHVKRL